LLKARAAAATARFSSTSHFHLREPISTLPVRYCLLYFSTLIYAQIASNITLGLRVAGVFSVPCGYPCEAG
jgi:hypothetical protein